MSLELQVEELRDELEETKDHIQKLAELQAHHEHQDEIRALKQDQLISNIQALIGGLKEYQCELHDACIKNMEDVAKLDKNHAKTAARVKILYGIMALVGGAALTGLFEWLPQILELVKGK
jgi:sugar-specific transcriptional regulator TrmB